ncbi:MAG: hypothetical protein JNN05_10610 [Candidatus Omnitrophica bacterium]|nr:hypothetical protein [Candidatus Omnitrophota bacterium]
MKLKDIKDLMPEKLECTCTGMFCICGNSESSDEVRSRNQTIDLLGDSEVGVDVEAVVKILLEADKDADKRLEWVGRNINTGNTEVIKSNVGYLSYALSASIEKWLVKK